MRSDFSLNNCNYNIVIVDEKYIIYVLQQVR